MNDFKKSAPRARKPYGARAGERGSSSFGARPFATPVERFQATCNECHQKCEVPFRPNGKKPVYCRDCFKGKEDAPSYGKSAFRREGPASADLSTQFELLNLKLDRLIQAIEGRSRS